MVNIMLHSSQIFHRFLFFSYLTYSGEKQIIAVEINTIDRDQGQR